MGRAVPLGAVILPGRGDETPMRRDLEQAERLELGLVKVRWLLIAYAVVQTMVETRRPERAVVRLRARLRSSRWGSLLSNLFFAQFVRPRPAVPTSDGWAPSRSLLDTVVILEWVWVAADEPSDPDWVIAYLLPIEGAMRYGIPGAFAPLPVLLVSEIAREMSLAEEFPGYRFVGPAVAFRVGMAAVIALVAGVFASSLRKEARPTRRNGRRRRAGGAARRGGGASARPRPAATCRRSTPRSSPASRPRIRPPGIQAIAEAVGRELAATSLGVLLLEPDENGTEQLVAAGVFGDPGYRRNTRFVAGSEPFGSAPDLVAPAA